MVFLELAEKELVDNALEQEAMVQAPVSGVRRNPGTKQRAPAAREGRPPVEKAQLATTS